MVRRGASSKSTCRVIPGDCLKILRDLPEDYFDASVTDPPYDLTAGKKGGTVLDLFAGTGTTGQACLAEGFSSVLIERDPVALELIRVRIPDHQ